MKADKPIRNITDRLFAHAKARPQDPALEIFGETGRAMTFGELWTEVDRVRLELDRRDFGFENRVLLLAPVGTRLLVMIIALFASGITPVLIDPRLSRDKWKAALKLAGTRRLIGVPKLRWLKRLWPPLWRMRILNIDLFFSAPSAPHRSAPYTTPPLHICLATLTSGTTGQPKLIPRTFAVLAEQQRMASRYLPPLAQDRHLTVYALSGLQSLVDGAWTMVAPHAKATELIRLIRERKVTRFSGPPSIYAEILSELEKSSTELPSLECALIGGAPVPRWLEERSRRLLPQTALWIVYGSTECEPISFVRSEPDKAGIGYRVGPVIGELELFAKNLFRVRDHECFEVVLKGKNLVGDHHETFETGDIASLDDDGHLRLFGRRSEMVRGLPAGFLEEPLERLPGVRRVAVVEKGPQVGAFIEAQETDDPTIRAGLLEQVQRHLREWGLTEVQLKFMDHLPVDVRHRWKIQRQELRDLL